MCPAVLSSVIGLVKLPSNLCYYKNVLRYRVMARYNKIVFTANYPNAMTFLQEGNSWRLSTQLLDGVLKRVHVSILPLVLGEWLDDDLTRCRGSANSGVRIRVPVIC